MGTIQSIMRCGSIGGSLAKPTKEKAVHVAPEDRKRRPNDTHATYDEIQMCLNCKKNIKNHGCDEETFRACSREMKKERDK
ncbi:MAG: hypothetical protein IJO52_00090 [Clostridia bacterium]|nr:hypothetical protein [Clostridia bacterium]